VVGNIINTEVNILDVDYIQTSISFNPGYEGMGIFDLNAELVGLLTYKLPEINKQSLYLPIQTVADYLR
jgi:S1-C subfamily serine protease